MNSRDANSAGRDKRMLEHAMASMDFDRHALPEANAFLDRVAESRLLSPADVEAVRCELEQLRTARDVAARLLKRRQLTAWQARMLLAGRTAFFLGRYELLDRIGAGGMGTVFKARHAGLRRIVAVKVMSERLVRDSESVARFQREIRAAALLDHPNIVHAYDAEIVGTTHLLVMEYVPGESLGAMLHRRERLPIGEACEYARQAALGLTHAHRRGMVHRDIKPDNLLLASIGRQPADGVDEPSAGLRPMLAGLKVKLLDFGLARLRGAEDRTQLTAKGRVMGTVDYMSPEQALASAELDPRNDLYSLGCTLYRAIAGGLPFAAGGIMQRLHDRLSHDPPALSARRRDVPPELDALVQRLLARQPDDRPSSADDVADSLSAFASLPTAGDDGLFLDDDSPSAASHSDHSWVFDDDTDLDRFLHDLKTVATGIESPDGLTRLFAPSVVQKKPEVRKKTQAGRTVVIAGIGAVCVVVLIAFVAALVNREPTATPRESNLQPVVNQPEARPGVVPFTPKRASALQVAWAKKLGVPVEFTTRDGIRMRLIPPGEFEMGSTADELKPFLQWARKNDPKAVPRIQSEMPRHRVRIKRAYYISVHEITQSQMRAITGRNTSFFHSEGKSPELRKRVAGIDTGNFPADFAYPHGAARVCNALSEREGIARAYYRFPDGNGRDVVIEGGNGYRMPTEEEWEFACRAGSDRRYPFGDTADDIDRYARVQPPELRTDTVGKLRPNAFGLHDMIGNVSEWCLLRRIDWSPTMRKYQTSVYIKLLKYSVQRGGRLTDHPHLVRSSSRWTHVGAMAGQGIRVCRTVGPREQEIEIVEGKGKSK